MGIMRLILIVFLSLSLFIPGLTFGQGKDDDKKNLSSVAKEIIDNSRYCALITLDESGHPQTRTMEPFPPEDNFVIWFGTNSKSRKVGELNNDSRATVYYFDQENDGYVVLLGHAFLINDSIEKENRWKDHWVQFYPDRENYYTLIKFIPDKLEIVSPKHGLSGESITWRAHQLNLPGK